MEMDKYFSSPMVTKEMHCEEFIYCISKKLLNVAFTKYKTHELDKIPTVHNSIFLAALRMQEIKHLDNVIRKFDINLKTLTVHYKGKQCTAMQVATSLKGDFANQYLDLLCTKYRIHPDHDASRADFVKMNSMTALMYACNSGNLPMVQQLLKYGADINLATQVTNIHEVSTFRTPFSTAIGSVNFQLVKFLVDQGADPMKATNLLHKWVAEHIPPALASNLNLMPSMGYGLHLRQYRFQRGKITY
ncbi:MAG: ankyrin repeat domain-containing protein [Rickettsiaceae bacterium]